MNKKLDDIDLTNAQLEEVSELLKRYLPGTEVWAYGSRVTRQSNPTSDLDLVAFASPKQNMAVYDLKEAFDESYLPFRVDLFIWDDIPESFQENIKNDYVVLQDKTKNGNHDE